MSIKVRNLSHIYAPGMPDEHKALVDVSFDVEDGMVAAVIGHTGSGKSTLLQHLNGLLKATEGTIEVEGLEVTDKNIPMRDVRRKVGLVFQYPEYQLFEETVAKDVAFGPKNLGLDEEEIQERAKRAVALVGLDFDKIKDSSPFELSGGQKRRVAIAGVIAMEPRVLILDEPTAGLDPGAHKNILNMIRDYHKAQGGIIIIVSHNMADVASLADKILVMDRGRLVMEGSPKEVFKEREMLNSIGLDVPPIEDFMYELKEAGLEINTNMLSADDAADEIVRALRG